jgi:hypothetical protein
MCALHEMRVMPGQQHLQLSSGVYFELSHIDVLYLLVLQRKACTPMCLDSTNAHALHSPLMHVL